jgi:DNA-binding CsgD family transcriptional regulator
MEVFMASLADEEENTRKLTNRQKTFARLIVEGVYSNAECARRAGYVPDSADCMPRSF